MRNKSDVLIKRLWQLDNDNRDRTNRYLEILEKSNPEDIPKTTHLYAIAAFDLYVIQTRIQAAESFEIAKKSVLLALH